MSIKPVLFSSLLLAVSQVVLADSSFTICSVVSSSCARDAHATWTDELSRRDYESRKYVKYKYDGIAIVSNGQQDNLVLFIKGYNGMGRYNLEGTSDGAFSEKSNAVYSDDISGWAHWVSPDKRGGSYVEISHVNNGLISGTYTVTVYYEGNSENKPVKLRGGFSGVPRKIER